MENHQILALFKSESERLIRKSDEYKDFIQHEKSKLNDFVLENKATVKSGSKVSYRDVAYKPKRNYSVGDGKDLGNYLSWVIPGQSSGDIIVDSLTKIDSAWNTLKSSRKLLKIPGNMLAYAGDALSSLAKSVKGGISHAFTRMFTMWFDASIHFADEIPLKKEKNAKETHKIINENILLLIDNTKLGSATDSVLFTENGISIYFKKSDNDITSHYFKWEDLYVPHIFDGKDGEILIRFGSISFELKRFFVGKEKILNAVFEFMFILRDKCINLKKIQIQAESCIKNQQFFATYGISDTIDFENLYQKLIYYTPKNFVENMYFLTNSNEEIELLASLSVFRLELYNELNLTENIDRKEIVELILKFLNTTYPNAVVEKLNSKFYNAIKFKSIASLIKLSNELKQYIENFKDFTNRNPLLLQIDNNIKNSFSTEKVSEFYNEISPFLKSYGRNKLLIGLLILIVVSTLVFVIIYFTIYNQKDSNINNTIDSFNNVTDSLILRK